VIAQQLPTLIKNLNIKSFLDAPCGDWYWMQHLNLAVEQYIGIDIVDDLIKKNNEKFSSTSIKFSKINIIHDPLPKVDLIFSRDCLVHLNFHDALQTIANFKSSAAKYLLTTTFTKRDANHDLIGESAFWRPLNLQLPPFNFPPPQLLINEQCSEGAGGFTDKSLGLWLLSEIPLSKAALTINHTFSPMVSIIIPVYNGSNYMQQAIDSALKQTYPNIEILVINDGSSDAGKTEAIAHAYGNRIRYFYKDNGGCASALNLGLMKMQGEYFSWLSHDDIYYPEKIQHQINILNTLANKNTILYGGYELINTDSETIAVMRPEEFATIEKLNTPLFPLMHTLINGCTLLIPTKYFKEIGCFDETLPTTNDYALWFQFLRVAPIHFDKKILVRYRTHPEQSTHAIKTHSEECENFWIHVLKQLTPEEMIHVDDSCTLFLEKKLIFFKSIGYNKAYGLANSMLTKIKKSAKFYSLSTVKIYYASTKRNLITTIKSLQSVGVSHTCTRIRNRLANKFIH
jgi:glycosyltransferase involved in cell wall biosynthesis